MKRENQLTGTGQFLIALGFLAFVPSFFGRELLILAWLGSWQQPVGLSALVVGGVLFGLGKLQALRDPPPTVERAQRLPAATADPATAAPTVATPAPQPNVLSTQVPTNQTSIKPAERR